MDSTRKPQIINLGFEEDDLTKEEQWVACLKALGVDIKNPDGTYKSLEDIFLELHDNVFGKKD